ncbi:MAG: hypothetical protein IT266_02235 [Saprospiraceae bacterium]|nr:hypothetical protein [Saprospiraceae bacterium]
MPGWSGYATKNYQNNIDVDSPQPIYSHHVFLFPFRWDACDPEKLGEASLSDRLKREEFIDHLNSRWEPSRYSEEDPINYYNSSNYFYEFVRKAIYALDGKDSTVLNFHYNQEGKSYYYNITRRTGELETDTRIYKLKVNHIGLNIYNTGIAILSFHLLNEDINHNNFDDILAINDFGRRMYPQFLDSSAKATDAKDKDPTIATQYAFMAKSLIICAFDENGNPTNTIFEERFSDFSSLNKLQNTIKSNPTNLPNTPKSIASLLGEKIGTTEHKSDDNKKVVIRAILDDRNFVICWHGNDDEITKLAWDSRRNQYSYLDYSKNENWLKYVFVDNSNNTLQSRTFRRQVSQDHTYDRWIEMKTLYGLSRYSLVCLTNIGWFQENVLRKQIGGGVYFEMAQLLLAQRASIIRFSDEATLLASQHIEHRDAQFLHEKYMRFVNQLYFREATAQEQGIEMYRLLSNFMELDRDVQNLNNEIDELDQFVSMQEQTAQTAQATKLTKVATILLPATLIAGVFGMNTLDTTKLPPAFISCTPQLPFLVSILALILLSLILIISIDEVFDLHIFNKSK